VKFILALGLSLAPLPALADPCTEEIAALFSGGAMDPFARPPHRQEVTEYDEAGTETRRNLNIVETPLRTIAGVNGEQFTLAVDRDLWNAPAPEGPWTPLGYQMPEGREAAIRASAEQHAANLSETACHGADAEGLLHYVYRSRTDEDASGNYHGGLYEIRVNPGTGRVERMEITDFVNAWTEGVSRARHEIVFTYDDTIRVTPPEQ
jgi:hypothetical protein